MTGWRVATDENLREENARLKAEYGRVIALANDLAAMLLAVEWSVAPGGCPRCKNLVPYEHATDCSLDAALRAAGARP